MSLVDKESMRKKLGYVAEKIKVWMKAQEEVKASMASEAIKAAVVTTLDKQKV